MEKEIVSLVQENMLSYAGAVNQSRAIPDARTGLKPIHRKILYQMWVDKITHKGKFKKCASMVGQTIARFSEHGDAATYDALVRLAQPWIQRNPLVDFHGNYGSPFGDPAASMRYTEAKLAALAEDGFFASLNKDTVEWKMNYTNEEKEPVTLPAIFPGLFCLPTQGIGYAIASNFLTFNLQEVADMICEYIRTGNLKVINYDLASGGTIVNPQIMNQIYETGKGSVIVEAKYSINGTKISFTELPFNVMFEDVKGEIIELCEKEELPVVDVIDNSGKNKMELVIVVANPSDAENVLHYLLTGTKLRNSYGVNQVALVDDKPCLLSIKQMVEVYINHNLECLRREFAFDKKNADKRVHILKGLIKASENIDDVINIIRNSQNKDAASEKLQEKYGFSEEQVKSILNMRLSSLTKIDAVKSQEELEEKEKLSLYCQEVISSNSKREEILMERLENLAKKYGTPRRTAIEQKEIQKVVKDKDKGKAIVPENVVVNLTTAGYLQSAPVRNHKPNKNIKCSFKTTTLDMILLVSNFGKIFRILAGDIKSCSSRDKGTACGALVTLEPKEKIVSIFNMSVNPKRPYLTGFTREGMVKKSNKDIYTVNKRSAKGTKAAGLKEGDEYISFFETNGDYAVVTSNDGYKLQFHLDDIKPTGKTSKGRKAMNTDAGIKSVEVMSKPCSEIPVQRVGGKGRK